MYFSRVPAVLQQFSFSAEGAAPEKVRAGIARSGAGSIRFIAPTRSDSRASDEVSKRQLRSLAFLQDHRHLAGRPSRRSQLVGAAVFLATGREEVGDLSYA